MRPSKRRSVCGLFMHAWIQVFNIECILIDICTVLLRVNSHSYLERLDHCISGIAMLSFCRIWSSRGRNSSIFVLLISNSVQPAIQGVVACGHSCIFRDVPSCICRNTQISPLVPACPHECTPRAQHLHACVTPFWMWIKREINVSPSPAVYRSPLCLLAGHCLVVASTAIGRLGWHC